ncbi:centrosomal protein 20-like [Aethina tumida]|uniref:centrosomal protein 20-like n=1 Tax=Aethina tumida TaxID=116153 RepID=UPI00096AEB81|nr:centrosomal protein 20-like [Aethina tumida]
MTEVSESCLLKAIKQSLETDGRLGRFKGEIRAAVMSILNKNSNIALPEVPEETRLINELIREYLVWNGYLYTEQILSAECGQTNERVTRDVLTTKLGVVDDEKTVRIPLLYYIVAAFQNINNADEQCQT